MGWDICIFGDGTCVLRNESISTRSREFLSRNGEKISIVSPTWKPVPKLKIGNNGSDEISIECENPPTSQDPEDYGINRISLGKTKISSISIQGNGSLDIETPSMLDPNVKISIQGKAVITTWGRKRIDHMTLVIVGSGLLQGKDVFEVDHFDAVIFGEGGIHKIYAETKMTLNVIGNGRCSLLASPTCDIRKSVLGTGSVLIATEFIQKRKCLKKKG
jgi:hypothetical protein